MKYAAPSLIIILLVLTAGGQQNDAVPAVELQPAAQTDVVKANAGLWIGIGPNMEVLPLGTYRFIFVPADASEQVTTTTIVTGAGVPGPVPPTDTGLASKVSAALAKVTAADKATTAANLVKVYDSLVESIESGSLKDAGQVATAVNLLTSTSLGGKSGWTDFISVVGSAMSSATNVTSSSAALKTISAELKKIQ